MKDSVPLIKKFKTKDKFYIYDTWTNEILDVHPDFWNNIEDTDDEFPSKASEYSAAKLDEIKYEIEKAKEMGYLSIDRPRVATYYGWKNWKEHFAFQINHNLEQLTLNVTEKCNFRCSYCVYSEHYKKFRNHSTKQMTWDIAKRAIEYAMEHSDHRVKNDFPLAISFYGGEPLCNFKLIKNCVVFCKEQFFNRQVKFNMTTNGSLINKEIARFLIDNEFTILLSIDGPQFLHDRYRRTLSGKPTFFYSMKGYNLLRKLDKKNKVSISFNCVVSPPFNLGGIKLFVDQMDQEVRLNSVSSYNTTFFDQFNMNKELSILQTESNKLLEVYIKSIRYKNGINRDKMGKAFFEPNLIKLAKREMNKMETKTASHGQCILGARKLFVSCEGFLYPCERVNLAYCIGHIKTGINIEYIYKLIEGWSNFFKYICPNCWAIRLCHKCIADFDIYDNYKSKMVKKFCSNQKKSITQDLVNYCTILEHNPHNLDFLKDAIII